MDPAGHLSALAAGPGLACTPLQDQLAALPRQVPPELQLSYSDLRLTAIGAGRRAHCPVPKIERRRLSRRTLTFLAASRMNLTRPGFLAVQGEPGPPYPPSGDVSTSGCPAGPAVTQSTSRHRPDTSTQAPAGASHLALPRCMAASAMQHGMFVQPCLNWVEAALGLSSRNLLPACCAGSQGVKAWGRVRHSRLQMSQSSVLIAVRLLR